MTVRIDEHLAERRRAYALDRRQFITRAAGGLGLVLSPALLAACGGDDKDGGTGTSASTTQAAKALATLNVYGITTFKLDDWSALTEETGVQNVKWTDAALDPAVITNEIKVNDLGGRTELFVYDGSTQGNWAQTVGEELLPIDTAKLKNYAGIADEVKNSPLGQGKDGKLYGVPIALNADSFTYYTDVIKDEGPVSWSVIFDDERTKGKVALYDFPNVTMGEAAAYLKESKGATIGDPANLTDGEIKQVADYLIERKKAGQFRTFWATYDESVQLLSSRDVVAAIAWEPTVAQLKGEGKPVAYATTKEGYFKWIEHAWVFKGVQDRGTEDAVYKVLDYLLGGNYAFQMATLRGYAGARPDLAVEWANANGASKKDIAAAEASVAKVAEKFTAPHFFENINADNQAVFTDEWSRFKEA